MNLFHSQIIHLGNKKKILSIGFIIIIFLFYFSLPKKLFNDPTCTVLTDSENRLLSAHIATDGQWRFPHNNAVPDKFKQAILHFEDQYFYYHPGVNPVSVFRALKQNIKARKVVSGGSTISSQVIRLSRKGKKRSVGEKIIEFVLAFRLELKYSKDQILALYTSNAPFGGNVVGLDAAAWRYYGRSANKLSWAEAATLAVLPNAPALIYPGKNHEILIAKRNRLLDKLQKNHIIDQESCQLAKYEQLPLKPLPLPNKAPHLLNRASTDSFEGKKIHTSIQRNIQEQTLRIIDKHYQILSQNEILNAAALVINVKTGKVIAYVGNTNTQQKQSGKDVDIITAQRSTGSTLKPILYALMQKEGMILPHTLIPDIPTHIAGYAPKNFNKKYAGAVPANNALARSLNIPAVRMLKDYGLERFHENLRQLHLTTFTKPASHYGLSLILGGAETTLWELSGLYASFARLVNNFAINNSGEQTTNFFEPTFMANNSLQKYPKNNFPILDAPSIWLTFEALTEMHRPIEGSDWRLFESSKKIAWKTGTSFGHRDAWAFGVTPEFVVGVWVGNADGEGRPGLTGASTAAPIMFDIYKQLPKTTWFDIPYDELIEMPCCAKSGYKASIYCENIDTLWISKAGDRTKNCPYHKKIHLDTHQKYQVNADCYPVSKMITKNCFVLPPALEYYYKNNDPFYRVLPPFHPSCTQTETHNIDIIYPKQDAKIFIPKGLNSKQQRTVFEVAHRINNCKIYWHLDDQYIGSTEYIHKMELTANSGNHTLTLIDDNGETKILRFEILKR